MNPPRKETEFEALEDARAGAVLVAAKYGLTITIWRLGNCGRYLVNNWREPKLENAVFVEKHVGHPPLTTNLGSHGRSSRDTPV